MTPYEQTDTVSDPFALLESFGLTRQEAAVYCTLLAEGELNGYEVAKVLGISRSNAYTALAGLTDRGAAWQIDGNPTRYTAVAAAEFCTNRLRRLEAARDRLLACLPERRQPTGSFATIRGAGHILDRLDHLLADTRERVYLALDATEVARIQSCLEGLLDRGLKVVLISDAATVANLKQQPVWQRAGLYAGSPRPGQIQVIVDSRFVLTGSLSGGQGASCLHSDQANLVELFKTALRNEIRLIELGQKLPMEE